MRKRWGSGHVIRVLKLNKCCIQIRQANYLAERHTVGNRLRFIHGMSVSLDETANAKPKPWSLVDDYTHLASTLASGSFDFVFSIESLKARLHYVCIEFYWQQMHRENINSSIYIESYALSSDRVGELVFLYIIKNLLSWHRFDSLGFTNGVGRMCLTQMTRTIAAWRFFSKQR